MDILALYDEDVSYTSAFADYLNRKKVLAFDVFVFTDLELLREFISSRKVSVLIGRKEILSEFDNYDIDRKIVLSDGSIVSEGDEFSIYKYDSMEKIVDQVSEMYGYLNIHNKNNFEGLIGVYSPYSMNGKLDYILIWKNFLDLGHIFWRMNQNILRIYQILCMSMSSLNLGIM